MTIKLKGGPLDGQTILNAADVSPIRWLLYNTHNMAQYKRGAPLALNDKGEPTELAYEFTGLTEMASH